MARTVEVDYLVVGAGAAGMAFADALVDHADVRVALVDRRHGVGGHWLDAYPFVRLHQASAFYGVASTLLGGGRLQTSGPEIGLHERASVSEICLYYERVLARLLDTDRVRLFAGCEHVGDRRVVSRVSGRELEVPETCRVVNAHYLAPEIPACTPPPFEVGADADVVPVGGLARLARAHSEYVVVGAGKTASDACTWLLARGVDPDAICWVRPRDPWFFNRAVVQPDPVAFLGMVGDVMQAGASATSLEDLFLRLEEAGVVLRIDRGTMPTMAKTPTLAAWELELLREIEHVVHCAARGLQYPPTVPIWGPDAITVQPIRTGFPCFGAALAGYVEATRDDDATKNRLCPATPLPDTLASWVRATVLGARAATSFSAEPDIRAWADTVALNPARIPPGHPGGPALDATTARLRAAAPAGLVRLAELGGVA